MGRLWRAVRFLAPALMAAAWYIAAHHTHVSGSAPLLHAGIPWGFREEDIPDLSGKLALVTGGNVGLGHGTAQLLLQRGARVHVTARSGAKCERSVEALRLWARTTDHVNCSVLELGSLSSVAAWLRDAWPPLAMAGGLDVVALNAGVMATPYQLSEDGIEWQFAVNHVGHFALARGILPLVEKAATRTGDARMVLVSSVAHVLTPPQGVSLSLEALNDEAAYSPHAAYGQSKLANILLAKELQRRFDEKGSQVFVNAVHPGSVRGQLLRHGKVPLARVVSQAFADQVHNLLLFFSWPERQAALTSLYAATSPEVRAQGLRGRYFVPIAREWSTSAQAQNASLARDLWEFTARLVDDKTPERTRR